MNAEVKITGCTGAQVHEIAAELSKRRDLIPTYNASGSVADHFMPRVCCEGPEFFTVVTPVMPASLVADVLRLATQ